MLPLTPISPYVRLKSFVRQEWDLYFKGKTDNIDDGWKGVLYANYAMLDPEGAFNFFNDATFQNKWLDGGASRTWYLVFAGGMFFLAITRMVTNINIRSWWCYYLIAAQGS
jgi:endo-1,3(4)-beta-glucanase